MLFFSSQDFAREEHLNSETNQLEYTGNVKRRVVLVLDCVVANEFCSKMSDLINLQHYVIREKRLSEKEAIIIFFDIVRIIECLHKVVISLLVCLITLGAGYSCCQG
jgi:serine/threonine-protein kinase 40